MSETERTLYIGSHLSTAGGWGKLLDRSHKEDGTAFAFFPRSPYGKRSKSLTPEGAAGLAGSLVAEQYGPLVAHAPYVYNFAAKDEAKREFAVNAMIEDLRLLSAIRKAGQPIYLNVHPGAHVGQGSETGCRLIAESLSRVLIELGEDDAVVPILLETMAGKGTECGRTFEEIATIIAGIEGRLAEAGVSAVSREFGEPLVGVTLDTCHVLDAGYDLVNDFDGVLADFDRVIGLDRLKAIHANDSINGLGSHKDRHANIGDGALGLPFFERMVNDLRLSTLPMILETKELTPQTHRDEIALIRSLRH
ncbi:deoxyribonuclease IV [Bifidobacterium vansinderenii]|uniref:Probable endonuclease 4 n=1 Tax=Bifidobacterium vansinderenii TaxID=1984871 RepID=A0A229VYY7_9BIFI|nr:deoxyribonuclease IV [Bifidobacterium vansinderenii]OXN00825.1 endonuclease IV [Bifidobacterium vansinderenii]